VTLKITEKDAAIRLVRLWLLTRRPTPPQIVFIAPRRRL